MHHFGLVQNVCALANRSAFGNVLAKTGRNQNILKYRNIIKRLWDLKTTPHAHQCALHRGYFGNIAPQELNAPVIGVNVACDQVEQCGFSSAIWPNDPKRLSPRHIKRDVLRNLQGSK